MKIRATFKDPDAVYEATGDAAREQVNAITGLSKAEGDDLVNSRQSQISDSLSPWIKYGEYITIEFDTEAGTATVVMMKEDSK